MNTLITGQVAAFIAVIEQAGVPVLRVGFTLAVIVFLFAGVFIWRRRHQFSIAIQTSRTMCPSFDTIVRRKSYLFGAA
jgi:hypothetical protein